MRCVDRKGNEIGENAAQGRVLKALYETAAGRILLGILVKPFVSKAGGFLLNQPVSKAAIAPFIKKNHIDMTDYEEREYRSYNDFSPGKSSRDTGNLTVLRRISVHPATAGSVYIPLQQREKSASRIRNIPWRAFSAAGKSPVIMRAEPFAFSV